MDKETYQIIENPGVRIPTIDTGKFKNNKTSMIGFIEIDVTNLRRNIKELRRKNINFSFTSCMIKIIADCVAANKQVHAALLNQRKLVLFNDVDLSISIERKLNDTYFPFPIIIRSADKKTVLEIDKEIKKETAKVIVDANDLFMPGKPFIGKVLLKLFYMIPSRIRVFMMEYMIKSPFRAKRVMGTVGFATVAMAGRLSGWVFPSKNPYSLYIALGSINKKPLAVNNEVQIREVLNMTAVFDHNVIDGTPARMFMSKLVDCIEKVNIQFV